MAQVSTQTSGSGSNYVNSVTIPLTVNPTAGNTLMVFIATSSNLATVVSSVTDNVGGTWVQAAAGTANNRQGVFWFCSNAPGGATTIYCNSGDNYIQWSIVVVQESGLLTTGAIDVSSSTGDSGYVNTHSSTGTTTAANTIVYGGYAGSAGAGTYTPGSGYGGLITANGDTVSATLVNKSETTAGSKTATINGAEYESGIMFMIALKKSPTTPMIQRYNGSAWVPVTMAVIH